VTVFVYNKHQDQLSLPSFCGR